MESRRGAEWLSHPQIWLLSAILAAISLLGSAEAEPFDGPSFRKGLWRFERTTGYPAHRVVLLNEGSLRCVDPTIAMREIFAISNVANCRSTRVERVRNKYVFANRCDYLGPVSTEITVLGEDGYVEVNILKVGDPAKVDKVIARRVGECSATGTTISGRDAINVLAADTTLD